MLFQEEFLYPITIFYLLDLIR